MDFAVPMDHRVKLKESEKRDKYPNLARELKKTLRNMKMTVIPIAISALGTISKGLVRDQRISRDHRNYNIIKMGQNTEKNPGDSRRLAVTQPQ